MGFSMVDQKTVMKGSYKAVLKVQMKELKRVVLKDIEMVAMQVELMEFVMVGKMDDNKVAMKGFVKV